MKSLARLSLAAIATTAFGALSAQAQDISVEQIDSTPTTTCTISYYGEVAAGRWRQPQQLQQIVLGAGELGRDAEIDAGFGVVKVRLSRERDANQNWKTTVAVSSGGSRVRVYDYGQAQGTNCPRPGANSVAGTASFDLTDDRAQARSQTQCIRAESTASGSEDEIALRVSCNQPHNPARDRERDLERAAGAGSGSSQKGSGAGTGK